MTETELARFRAGDPSLFRRLVEAESPRLLRYAAHLCGDPDQAADLAQETWVAAWRRRRDFRGDAPLLSWLVAICRARFLAERRTAHRRATLLAARPPDAAGADATVPADADHADPLAGRRLAIAIADLPDRQRDVLLLRLVHGLSTRDAAARLGIPEGTVKSALARAIRAMRALETPLETLRP